MSQSTHLCLVIEGKYRFRFRFGRCRYRKRSRMLSTEFEQRHLVLRYHPCQGRANPKFRCSSGRMVGICRHLNQHHNPFRNRGRHCCQYLPQEFGTVMSQHQCNRSGRPCWYQYSSIHQEFRRCRHRDRTYPECRHHHRRYLSCQEVRHRHYQGR